ncbi:hypothetical protein [Pseudooceanicola algae]|uniref:Uncharacterized protein n=1 Tax=Pseudooceanicola algae TaxID=1537215 RepID=A0A418SKE8_9RHOB|nr:hypothetical protein [Pseudooceanicola algae]QPM89113.1 hypothetical protein PSAL_003230 [Pseudooceanicola algae]
MKFNGRTEEQRLVAGILTQAFSDMFLVRDNYNASADIDAVQAIRFLTARSGSLAEWRDQLCSYLDLDGDVLAARVRAILDGKAEPPSADKSGRGSHAFQKRVHQARDRWKKLAP